MINSIFQNKWWLDAVAPGSWDEILIKENDEVKARLPFVYSNFCLGKKIIMPQLTQTLGPWINKSTAKYGKMLSQEKEIMFKIIESLPKFEYFNQNFHYSITNWLPFHWKGFNQTTRYTYLIEDILDLDSVWNGFLENIRREIRKAEKCVGIVETDDVNDLIFLLKKTFEVQGLVIPYDEKTIQRLDIACKENASRKIFIAIDAKGVPHAGIYIVWSGNSAYYLMGGGDPVLRRSGAMSLLLWHAIQYVSGKVKIFDFEGSMIEPIEKFFRAFGAQQKPYFQISKQTNRYRILSKISRFFP